MSGHTYTTNCALCGPIEWTEATLSFKLEPYTLVLVVQGPDTLYIRYALKTRKELVQWNVLLMQLERLTQRLRVRVITRSKTSGCVYAEDGVLLEAQKCAMDAQTLFRCGELRLESGEAVDTLELDHFRAKTEIFIPRCGWPGFDKLCPTFLKLPHLCKVMLHVAPNAAPDVAASDVAASDVAASDVAAPDVAGPESYPIVEGLCLSTDSDLTPAANAAWERFPGGLSCPVDAQGRALVEAWQNGEPVWLQRGCYAVEATLYVFTSRADVHLYMTRYRGTQEHIIVAANEKTRAKIDELASQDFKVWMRVEDTEKSGEGTRLDVADGTLTLTFGTSVERVELPRGVLDTALAGLPCHAPCIATHHRPSIQNVGLVWLWRQRLALWYYRVDLCCMVLLMALYTLAVVLTILELTGWHN